MKNLSELAQAIKNSTKEAKARHARFNQPIVYVDETGKNILEYPNGTKKSIKLIKKKGDYSISF